MLYGKKPNAADKFFIVPNVVFHLGLSSGEIVVYSYLMCCEDRKTFQCYPSYKTIGSAVGMLLPPGASVSEQACKIFCQASDDLVVDAKEHYCLVD